MYFDKAWKILDINIFIKPFQVNIGIPKMEYWSWMGWTPLHKKMKFFIKDFFSRCDQIRMKKSLMENFVFCAVSVSACPLVDIRPNLYAHKTACAYIINVGGVINVRKNCFHP